MIHGNAQSFETLIGVAPIGLLRARPLIPDLLGKMKRTARGIDRSAICTS